MSDIITFNTEDAVKKVVEPPFSVNPDTIFIILIV